METMKIVMIMIVIASIEIIVMVICKHCYMIISDP